MPNSYCSVECKSTRISFYHPDHNNAALDPPEKVAAPSSNHSLLVLEIGLSASTIASSFGKAMSDKKELEDYRPEDISLSLLRMISYNIDQISYLNALQYGIKRIFFGGYFIRGHAYTMDTISFAVKFWSKGKAQAMFLRHEGFLGALGAFMSYERHGLDDLMVHQLSQ